MDAISQGAWPLYYHFIGSWVLIISGILISLLIRAKRKVHGLERSFNELDEQAKLIVRTDLELNKAQEELDKRLNGLDALQKTSRLISTTLDENEIFERLNQLSLSELGFEKHLIFMYDDDKKLRCRVNFGFPDEEVSTILTHIEKDAALLPLLKENPIISSFNMPQGFDDDLAKVFHLKHFVIAPLFTQKKVLGIVFAGNQSDAFAITEGDEELISILSDQVGQAVGNARLFDQVYRSSQALELNVQERTKQLTSALEEVQKISKIKSEFVSAVSHELRTPLTSIKGYASILMTGKIGEIPEKVKERLEKINKHSDNLVKLINNLLDISKIESGRIEMMFTKQAMASIIDNIQDLLTPQLKEKNIRIVTQIPGDTPEMFMDVSQIERIFINLIGNAIKFTPVDGTITITARHNPKEITVTISDTGIGIDKENAAKLFNEFYRVENEINQNVKGSGLGLALSKKIIEAHNGRIWVTSELHKGSTFHFTLPLEREKKNTSDSG